MADFPENGDNYRLIDTSRDSCVAIFWNEGEPAAQFDLQVMPEHCIGIAARLRELADALEDAASTAKARMQ